jgi:hypothetical protein
MANGEPPLEGDPPFALIGGVLGEFGIVINFTLRDGV